jgi:hypothetical protein
MIASGATDLGRHRGAVRQNGRPLTEQYGHTRPFACARQLHCRSTCSYSAHCKSAWNLVNLRCSIVSAFQIASTWFQWTHTEITVTNQLAYYSWYFSPPPPPFPSTYSPAAEKGTTICHCTRNTGCRLRYLKTVVPFNRSISYQALRSRKIDVESSSRLRSMASSLASMWRYDQ